MKVHNITESQDLIQHLMSKPNNNPSFKVPITHLLKMEAKFVAADESKL